MQGKELEQMILAAWPLSQAARASGGRRAHHTGQDETVCRTNRTQVGQMTHCTKEFLRFRNKNIGKMALDCDGFLGEMQADLSLAPAGA